ncbi:MAG: hypothetical protein PHV97_06065 [Candidatus Omnitrophica bacterium]|nr:hypothetical protein [Candidatus Omnitrophota bacterium]
MTTKKIFGLLGTEASDSSHFAAARFREWFNQLLERAGIKTKKKTMEFSLASWEKIGGPTFNKKFQQRSRWLVEPERSRDEEADISGCDGYARCRFPVPKTRF